MTPKRLQGPLQLIGTGASRIVFRSVCNRFVYKVPRSLFELPNGDSLFAENSAGHRIALGPRDHRCDYLGQEHNRAEAAVSNRWGRRRGADGRAPARCKLLRNGNDILVMEAVRRYSTSSHDYEQDGTAGRSRAYWSNSLYDGWYQCGWTRDGRFVCYDYSYDSDPSVFLSPPTRDHVPAPEHWTGRLQGPLQIIGRGRNRTTMLSLCKRFVYKVPSEEIDPPERRHMNWTGGAADNRIEANISRRWGLRAGKGELRAARCRMLPGTNILVMEALDGEWKYDSWLRVYEGGVPVDWKWPAFAHSLVDAAGQWGYDRRGVAKVWDYAHYLDARLFKPIEQAPEQRQAA